MQTIIFSLEYFQPFTSHGPQSLLHSQIKYQTKTFNNKKYHRLMSNVAIVTCTLIWSKPIHSVSKWIIWMWSLSFLVFTLKPVNNCTAVSLFNCEPGQGQLSQHPNGMLHCVNWRFAMGAMINFITLNRQPQSAEKKKWCSVELVSCFFVFFVCLLPFGWLELVIVFFVCLPPQWHWNKIE